MTATNHALTGAIIGATIANPWVAMLAALLSHFVLDAIPHYDHVDPNSFIKTRQFAIRLLVDAALCGTLVIALAILQPHNWWLMAICAFLGAAPDLVSANRWRHARQGKAADWKPSAYARFASKVQWFEHPIGAMVEVFWFGAVLTILISILRIEG